MGQVELVHSQVPHQVSVVHLITKCDLFKNNPGLIMSPYQVQSEVSVEDFEDFVSVLEDKAVKINDKNLPGLSELAVEFGFHALSGKLSDRRWSPALIDSQAAECRARISALEERSGQHEHQLAGLQTVLSNALKRFETDLMRLATDVKAVRDAQNSDSPLPAASAPPPTAPAADDARNRDRTLPVAAEAPPSAPAKKSKAAGVPSVPAQPVRLDSLIVREYPPLFEEFRMKSFNLLWRGSRDGFTADEFHRRCDGHANTLTLILTQTGMCSTVSRRWSGSRARVTRFTRETTAYGVSSSR
jgi:uncharacterized coiled-coil protein SlyX